MTEEGDELNANDLYNLAVTYSALSARVTEKEVEPDGAILVKKYAESAIDFLRRSIEKGLPHS